MSPCSAARLVDADLVVVVGAPFVAADAPFTEADGAVALLV